MTLIPAATPEELEELIHRLLHNRPFRHAFIAGTWRPSPALGASLATIDHRELESAARIICGQLTTGDPRKGEARLASAFPATLTALEERGVGRQHVAYAFLASPWYTQARDHSLAGRGPCLEEAFQRFVVELPEASTGDIAALCKHELVSAVLKLLACQPDLDFELPDFVEDNGSARFAILRSSPAVLRRLGHDVDLSATPTWLFAASQGRYLTGAIPEAAATILRLGSRARAETAHDELITSLEALSLIRSR